MGLFGKGTEWSVLHFMGVSQGESRPLLPTNQGVRQGKISIIQCFSHIVTLTVRRRWRKTQSQELKKR
uniref:S2 protein n=1 Tax=Equine infectious anemia virus TaxID=11665 RepID=A0A5J6SB12_9RETR|nr:S2 protein [Equine infectious anemia virus]